MRHFLNAPTPSALARTLALAPVACAVVYAVARLALLASTLGL